MDDVSSLAARVAGRTADRDMRSEDWTRAVAVAGLVATGEPRYVKAARERVDRSVATQTSAGYLAFGSHDPVPPSVLDPSDWPDYDDYQWQCHGPAVGRNVLEFYDRTDADRYLDAAERQYEALLLAERTADGGISYNGATMELWVDSLYMVPPFFARYGAIAEDSDAFAEAVQHVAVQADHLQDDRTKLFRHIWRERPNSYPESTLWSRGNGWAAAGIVDTLRYLPDDQADRDRLVSILRGVCEALRPLQDDSGFWHNLLDDWSSPLETSGTLMFAYAFARGVEAGYLDESYLEPARRAMDACRTVVDENGDVTRVALPPGGPDVPLGTTSYGQGWFLLAADALDRLE